MKTLPLLLALGLLGAGCEAKLAVSSQPTKAKLAPYSVVCSPDKSWYSFVQKDGSVCVLPHQSYSAAASMAEFVRKLDNQPTEMAASEQAELNRRFEAGRTNSWKECQ